MQFEVSIETKNMKKAQPAIFLNSPSVIDFAFITSSGLPKGYSVAPNVIVGGDLDPEEQVVVDFSAVKKSIKQGMDDSFDHRLVVFRFKDTDTYLGVDEVTRDNDLYILKLKDGLGQIELPEDALRFVEVAKSDLDAKVSFAAASNTLVEAQTEVIMQSLNNYLTGFLQEAMDKLYPEINIQVTTAHNEEFQYFFHGMDPKAYPTISFNYVHGLKKSTSYGCKNLAHGHKSFIHFEPNLFASDENQNEAWEATKKAQKELGNSLFVFLENLVNKPTDDALDIQYTTEDRGYMRMVIDVKKAKELGMDIHFMDAETTVENMAEYVVGKYFSNPNVAKALTKMYISEGLSKGSVISL